VNVLAPLIVTLTTSWTVLGTLAVAKATRKPSERHSASRVPAVTVLKPLAGADPSLYDNLKSFFEQDHPDLELIFGVEREEDPALAVVRRLIAEHPLVKATVVVHKQLSGLNPKVRNLRGMIPHARNDLVLISDSNIRAPRHYVRQLAAIKASDPAVGLLTNLVAGEGSGSLGSELESVQLSGFIAAGAALPTTVGDATVIGKSMLMSRWELDAMGGLDTVVDILAEDYVIGKMFERAGKKVVVAPTVLSNVVGPIDLGAVFDRHLRWSMMRARLRPFFFLIEPLTVPLFVLPAAIIVLGSWAFAWLVTMWMLRDVGGWLLLRGRRGLLAPLCLGGLRDLLALVVWTATPFKRHVAWRGNRVRVGAGTALSIE
jgi:ceramide glucosyltransferase